MPKFKVYASELTYHRIEVEAEDQFEAMNKAFEMYDGWEEIESVSWQIESAELIPDKKIA